MMKSQFAAFATVVPLMSMVILGGALIALPACTTKNGKVQADIPPEPLEDSEYAPTFKKWHQRVSLVDQFQKRIDAEAVLLTDDMRKSYAARWARIRGDREAEINALSGGKLAVFVSVFTPEYDFADLDNRQLWTLSLRMGAQSASPALVKRIAPKSAFAPFFPFVTQWSSDYIVVFDASSSGLGDGALVKPTDAVFSLRSALASLEFAW